MKIYRRDDGFEVQDAADRPIEWAIETYGGNFIEVQPPAPPDPAVIVAEQYAKEAKKQSAMDKLMALGLTCDEVNALIGG